MRDNEEVRVLKLEASLAGLRVLLLPLTCLLWASVLPSVKWAFSWDLLRNRGLGARCLQPEVVLGMVRRERSVSVNSFVL